MPAHTFTTSRTTTPDPIALLNGMRAAAEDPTTGYGQVASNSYYVKKSTDWTSAQLAAVQTVIDTTTALTPAIEAQNQVDRLSVLDKKIILTILDQFNFIRARLPTPLAPIDIPTMIQAIRNRDVP